MPFTFKSDDTPKQLLARSRYIIAKKPHDRTQNQKIRAELLFKNYPRLHNAYKHTLEFRPESLARTGEANIYEVTS